MPKEDHETISRAEKWHQSGLEQILGCARSWYLDHMLQLETPQKLTTVAGTAYHAAVEAHERARMAGVSIDEEAMQVIGVAALDDELATADAAELAAVKIEPSKLRAKAAGLPAVLYGRDALVYQVHSCIASFWLPNVDGPSIRDQLLELVPLGVEVYGSAQLVDGARELGGTVDGVYWHPVEKRVIVVDHKTAGRLSDWRRPGKGIAQATHYSLLAYADEKLEQFSEHLPTRTYLPEVRFMIAARIEPARATTARSLTVVIQPDAAELVTIGRRVRDAEQVLAVGEFPANPAYEWCRTCPFRPKCVGGTRELMVPVSQLLGQVAA